MPSLHSGFWPVHIARGAERCAAEEPLAMPKIIFITPAQDRIEVEATPGQSVMQAAVSAGVPGIDADCGGAMSCATCHVRVAAEWAKRAGTASETERDMLEFDGKVTETSRLSCQIAFNEELDGLVVEVVGR